MKNVIQQVYSCMQLIRSISYNYVREDINVSFKISKRIKCFFAFTL